jgi:GT2 family glycosyltransferase
VTFVIATHNRRDVLLHTLEGIERCGLPNHAYSVLVVDNASTDRTAEAVGERFKAVRVLRQSANHGPCAKNAAMAIARGEFVIFLDDDSYPQPGSVDRMIERFEADPRLGAAVFTITLPDGSCECSAYPDVCIGCGTGFRRAALLQAGGLPTDFFMAAEEYDLSLRLLDASWRVRLFDHLHVAHLKSPASRFPKRVARLDARNNAMLALRYFPEPWRLTYALEWLERYRLMAIANGQQLPFWAGAASGVLRGMIGEHWPISAAAFEQFAKIEQTHELLRCAVDDLGLRRVLFVDLGKNMPAYRIAARRCGIEVVAIADERLGGRGFRHHGMPIVNDAQARQMSFDAAIISNLAPVQSASRTRTWRAIDSRPVVNLFESGLTKSEIACIASPRAA